MRINGWITELGKLLTAVVAALLLGLMLDIGAWLAMFVLLAYAIWFLARLRDLNHWLLTNKGEQPPEASGLWGVAFDRIYRLQKRQEQAQVELQSTVDYLQDSFASLGDGCVMVDAFGEIQWSNSAARRLLGVRLDVDVGRPLINLIRSPEFLRYFQARDYSERLQLLSPINRNIHLSLSVAVFGRGNRVILARDVTSNHEVESMRREFVANASHELRTPLTVIAGYLEAMANAEHDERWERPLEQMRQQTGRMQNLVQDLLSLSRLESLPKGDQSSMIDVHAEMDMLRDEILGAAKGERTVNIECATNHYLIGTEKELRSAFSNLAVNAARYTREGDSITLRWYLDGDQACFEVEDSGIGIEPQHLPRLTERFYRADASRSNETGGTGLGLAIVKHVLMRHNAQLLISSNPGKGSRFTCVFPHSAIQAVAA